MVIRTMPYHGKHRFLVSEEEAKAIVARENKMTGKEFVDSIYAKLGIERPEKTFFQKVAEEADGKHGSVS